MSKLEFLMEGMRPAHAKDLKPTAFHKTYAEVRCVDCKAKHKVFKQDSHQVKRCRPCQRKMRNARPKKAKELEHERTTRKRKKRRQTRPEPTLPGADERREGRPSDQVLNL